MMKNEKQVKLGNLHDLSVEELELLLEKQKKILKNSGFVNRLPDKGEKIRNLVARIEHVLAEKPQHMNEVDDTAEMFERMAVNAGRQRQAGQQQEEDDTQEDSRLREYVNTEHQGKVIIEAKPSQYVNSYDRVIKRTPPSSKPTKTFHANRTLKHTSIDTDRRSLNSSLNLQTVSEQNESSNINESNNARLDNAVQSDATTEPISDSIPGTVAGSMFRQGYHPSVFPKHGYDECLTYKSGTNLTDRRAVSITIEESVKLMEAQKSKHDSLQAVQAALRLSGKLTIPGLHTHSTRVSFNPDVVPVMSYRETEDVRSDVDSDDEVQDYPD